MNGGIWSANARTLSTEYEPLSDFIVPERAGSLYKLFLLFQSACMCVSVCTDERDVQPFLCQPIERKKTKADLDHVAICFVLRTNIFSPKH